jgi:hypothetical protein
MVRWQLEQRQASSGARILCECPRAIHSPFDTTSQWRAAR